ncbi:MAG: MYG1 family protein [Opitutaceae bacterium]|nr:MYG1 family protein [Opitutaceae bacterium]MBP9912163.1 MYG1 family protein [Opitutaceae bacterium]
MTSFTTILTHPGSAHKDEFLACCVLLAAAPVAIVRREPTEADLADPAMAVVDVGHRHEPALNNFDHHQLPDDAAPTCALSLVLQHLGLYPDAKAFCDWLEPAEWFDCRGPNTTARWLGVERDIINKLYSPIDGTLLRRFAGATRHSAGEPLWEIMRLVGADLLDYLRTLRARLTFIGQHAELWSLDELRAAENGNTPAVVFLPRTDPLPEEPSAGLDRYVQEQGWDDRVVAVIAPDRRSGGYGLSRHRDHPRLDFTRIKAEPDVHFAHARGFVAKTSATEPQRLRQLLMLAAV